MPFIEKVLSIQGLKELWIIIPVGIVLLLLLVLRIPRRKATSGKQSLTSAYVFDRPGMELRDADAPLLDQLFFSFALFHNSHVSGDHWINIAAFEAYIARYPHITPILSVGGWGADGFSQAASTSESRAVFVADVLALMHRHGFTGVDIDWEYPGSSVAGIASSPDDKENFTLLLQDLRTALDEAARQDGIPRRLCIAMGAAASVIEKLECDKVGQIIDQLNVMTYDLQGDDIVSHHTALYTADSRSPLSADVAIRAYMDAGIPASKLMLGAAFYGHRWDLQADSPLYHAAQRLEPMTYTEICALSDTHADALHFDDIAKAPYYYDGAIFISFDDERSIAQKRQYANQHQLMGLFTWEYGGDRQGTLLRAMQP